MIENIGEIFDTNFERVYRYFFYKTTNKADAEDLTSETFSELVEKIKSGAKIDNPSNYLFGIARRIFANYLRRKYGTWFVRLENEHTMIAQSDELRTNPSNFESYVQNLISKLPNKQKEILYMRLVEKKTFKDVCEILRKDDNYVKTTQRRGIENLKKMIACTPFST